MSQTNDATLADALNDLRRREFSESSGVVGSGLRAVDSGKAFRAEELIIREYYRFEGSLTPTTWRSSMPSKAKTAREDVGRCLWRLPSSARS